MTAPAVITIDHQYDFGPDRAPSVIATSLIGTSTRSTRFNPNLYDRPIERARLLAKALSRHNTQAGHGFASHWAAIAADLEKATAAGVGQ